jgi:hypothetical protein
MARLPSQTNLDVLITLYKEHRLEDANEIQKKLLERWNFTDNLIRKYESRETILEMLREKFQISESQAWRDISNAMHFFGSVNINEKGYCRIWYAQDLEQIAKECRAIGKYKEAIAAIKEAAEIRGLKDDDFDPEKYKNREFNQFIVNLTVQNNSGEKKKTIDLDKLDGIEEVEFEDIMDNIEKSNSVSEEDMQKLLNKKDE